MEVKPILIISQCLEIDSCRYDGQMIAHPLVRKLLGFVQAVPVCPEVEIGLGTPRDPLRLVMRKGEIRLYQPASGRNLSSSMVDFSRKFLQGLTDVDGVLLKSRSPSCGVRDTKIFPSIDSPEPLAKGAGLFASQIQASMPRIAVEDERGLGRPKARDRFLTKLFTLARLRRAKKAQSLDALADFHARHRLLLETYNRRLTRQMERLLESPAFRPTDEYLEAYEICLLGALARGPRYSNIQKVYEDLFEKTRASMPQAEKSRLGQALKNHRSGKQDLIAIRRLFRQWLTEEKKSPLATHVLLEPYPAELEEDPQANPFGENRLEQRF